jgi:hypothetical protein
MHEVNIQVWADTNGEYVPMRMGSQHELVSPCGSFKGLEGYIVVLVLDPAMAVDGACDGPSGIDRRPTLRHDARPCEEPL